MIVSVSGKQYDCSVKDMVISSQYSNKLNNFIKDSISHQNSLKMNNFDKKNKMFTKALIGKANNEKIKQK